MIHKYGFTDLTPEQRKALLLAESEHMAMMTLQRRQRSNDSIRRVMNDVKGLSEAAQAKRP